MADVAIRTEDSKLLHVNKSILAVYSPFFKALFFSNFAESKQDTVDVGIQSSVLLEILKVIHNVNRNCNFFIFLKINSSRNKRSQVVLGRKID